MTKFKKSLGQNFLRDNKILKKIADFACIEKEDTVIEVGSGEGTLTKLLLERSKKVIAIEKDKELSCKLIERFKDLNKERLEIINTDILEYNPEIKNYKLIGNIPYYITGAVFKKFLEAANQPNSITFVVQKEVAERIMSKDGKESILSISTKAYGDPYFGGVIKAGSFFPKPKVDSAIISVRNINRERFFSLREDKFFEILKKGFAHKRKLLIKNLGGTKEVFQNCSLTEKIRAEDLSVKDWFCLAREFSTDI